MTVTGSQWGCALGLLLITSMLGCRFGGGTGLAEEVFVDADAGVATASDSDDAPPPASSTASVSSGSSSSGALRSAGTGAGAPAVTSTGAAGAAASGRPAAAGASAPRAAGAVAAAGSCEGKRATIEVCDPITNVGCPMVLGMQCDVDLLATTLAGTCVFSAPQADPSSCLNIPPTESCPAQTTCIKGACAKVCLCDSDCDPGQRCTTPVGSGGFKICSPS